MAVTDVCVRNRRALRHALLLAALVCAPLAAFAPADAQESKAGEPWIMPFDIGQPRQDDPPAEITSQHQVYDFMWKTFVALNWPQLKGGKRGHPDSKASLAPWGEGAQSEGPVVWQTYRRPDEVFRPPKVWPITWNDPPMGLRSLCPAADDDEALVISSFSTNYSDNSDGLNQPFIQPNYPTGPVADQNGNYLRYEVGMNQAYFTYVGHYRYFKPDNQNTAVKNYLDYVKQHHKAPGQSNDRNTPFFQALPNGTEKYLQKLPAYALQGIVEWKAAWKVLGGDDVAERFYRRKAYFLNPDKSCTGPLLVGLVAFHIHRMTPQKGHIGTTFEQVDNTRLQSDYSSATFKDAAPLPPHASLNPGGTVSPDYLNGYEVCDSEGRNCQSGKAGLLPKPLKDGQALPPHPQISNVVRQVPIPEDVMAVNAVWRENLKDHVLFYYQMIGTQNANIDEPNPNLGPGVLGAQVSSTNNLINTALESYTQKGWSCALCHQNASPLGVSQPLPPFEEDYAPLHTISFLLQNARSDDGN